MNRRDFVWAGVALSGAVRLLGQESQADGWRTFEVTTRVEVLKPTGTTRVWVPAALTASTPYQRTVANTFQCDGGAAKIVESSADGLAIVAAEFPTGARPVLTVVSRVATMEAHGGGQKASAEELRYFLRATKYLPTDGIVKETAAAITEGAETDSDKARAIYEWIVENTHRDPQTRGCGLGDIRFMLESEDLGGKCADLNGLFVGLARAAGGPARAVYGIRTAKSQLGYKSLG